jgi:hypothetical protein
LFTLPILMLISNVIWIADIWILPTLVSLADPNVQKDRKCCDLPDSSNSPNSPSLLWNTCQILNMLKNEILCDYPNLSHLPKAFFEKNVTPLAKFMQVMCKFVKCCASGHCLM